MKLGIEKRSASFWRPCEHCTVRFKARGARDLYHTAMCRQAAGKGQIHPLKLDYLLNDLRRLKDAGKVARGTLHLWAWRHLLELRGIVSMARKEDAIRAMQAIIDALMEGTGFMAEGKRLVREHRERWQKLHDQAETDLAAGTIKEWPAGLDEYPFQELPGAE